MNLDFILSKLTSERQGNPGSICDEIGKPTESDLSKIRHNIIMSKEYRRWRGYIDVQLKRIQLRKLIQ